MVQPDLERLHVPFEYPDSKLEPWSETEVRILTIFTPMSLLTKSTFFHHAPNTLTRKTEPEINPRPILINVNTIFHLPVSIWCMYSIDSVYNWEHIEGGFKVAAKNKQNLFWCSCSLSLWLVLSCTLVVGF